MGRVERKESPSWRLTQLQIEASEGSLARKCSGRASCLWILKKVSLVWDPPKGHLV